MSDQPLNGDQELLFEQSAQILVRHIRASLEERGQTPQEVSLVFQEVSDRLVQQIGNSQKPVPESLRELLSVLIIDMRLW